MPGIHPGRRQGRRHGLRDGSAGAVPRVDRRPPFRLLAEDRAQLRRFSRPELAYIMPMSASPSDALTIRERLFENSPVTPAARANDATDIHILRGGRLHEPAARPFRTASLDHIQCGHLDCESGERHLGANLGLYSVTFNNDVDLDRQTLEQFKLFREEAERKGFRYFLEVFDPNVPGAVRPDKLGAFINDAIARALAGVAAAGRPLFLKIVYHGPQALEELVAYDPHLVVGILGGSAGTTRDAFQLLYDAKKPGARVALFGRKINNAECQLAFVEFLRLIADGHLEPVEAVKAYHGVLQKLGIPPHRSLEEDLSQKMGSMSYGGTTTISLPGSSPAVERRLGPQETSRATPPTSPCEGGESSKPDFTRMTPAERLAYHRQRLDRMLGR